MNDAFGIPLGSVVRDEVTGIMGIATSRTEYLNGCVQYGVSPKIQEDGTLPDPIGFDWQRLDIIGPGVSAKYVEPLEPQTMAPAGNPARSGGPMSRLSSRG
jgi:hypothetical protein